MSSGAGRRIRTSAGTRSRSHLRSLALSPTCGLSVAETMHRLQEMVPPEAELWCRPEAVVEYGQPGTQIVEAAERRAADLIVLGVRNVEHLFAATHLEIRTAHEVIAHAACPVLSVPTGFAPVS